MKIVCIIKKNIFFDWTEWVIYRCHRRWRPFQLREVQWLNINSFTSWIQQHFEFHVNKYSFEQNYFICKTKVSILMSNKHCLSKITISFFNKQWMFRIKLLWMVYVSVHRSAISSIFLNPCAKWSSFKPEKQTNSMEYGPQFTVSVGNNSIQLFLFTWTFSFSTINANNLWQFSYDSQALN